MTLAEVRGDLIRRTGGIATILVVVVGASSSAQEQIEVQGASYCMYTGGKLPEESLFAFEPPDDSLLFVRQMVEFVGIAQDRIRVKASNVGNAVAMLDGQGTRYILFSSTFFRDLEQQTGSAWAGRAVLAHELGHHLNQHLLDRTANQKVQELEADSFAGRILCRLGANFAETELSLRFLGSAETPTHPSTAARLEAVGQGFRLAVAQGDCRSRSRDSKILVEPAEESLVIDASNVATFLDRRHIEAGTIVLSDVSFAPKGPVALFANRLEMRGASRIVSRDLLVAAGLVIGGTIDGAGLAGEDGGELYVVAGEIQGTVIRAAGGEGLVGVAGASGEDGAAGRDGRNGECGPGALSKFVSSTAGENGADGQPGRPGGPGGNGGNGGVIWLATVGMPRVQPDVSGGQPGLPGKGGSGGRGGIGGRGGDGCVGLGGSQPSRSNGSPGRDGVPGSDGVEGKPGSPGSIWRVELDSLEPLAVVLSSNSSDESKARKLKALVRERAEK